MGNTEGVLRPSYIKNYKHLEPCTGTASCPYCSRKGGGENCHGENDGFTGPDKPDLVKFTDSPFIMGGISNTFLVRYSTVFPTNYVQGTILHVIQ